MLLILILFLDLLQMKLMLKYLRSMHCLRHKWLLAALDECGRKMKKMVKETAEVLTHNQCKMKDKIAVTLKKKDLARPPIEE